MILEASSSLIFYVSKVKSSLLKVVWSWYMPSSGISLFLEHAKLSSVSEPMCLLSLLLKWLALSQPSDLGSLVISTQSPPWPPHLKWPLVFLLLSLTIYLCSSLLISSCWFLCVLVNCSVPGNVGWDLLFYFYFFFLDFILFLNFT